MEKSRKPIKIVVNESNCEELTGYKASDLALLTGIEAYTTDYSYSVLGHSLAPSIHIKSNDDNVKMRRTFQLKDMVVENDRIDIVEQNEGTAMSIFTKQVALCREQGYRYITCIAARDVNMGGYYVWARAGFILHEDGQQDINNHLQRTGFNGEERMPHKIVLNAQHRKWWRDNGITWEGIFDLADNSESMQILEAYNREKQESAIRENVKAIKKNEDML